MSAQYSGALGSKRKAELTEIAQGLGIPDPEVKISELVKNIQTYLDANEAKLVNSPMYKGLYARKRHVENEAGDAKNAVEGAVKKSRKSINKTLDRVAGVIDPANIALPESPININRLAKDANESMSVALAPAQDLSRDLTVRARRVSNHVVKFGTTSQRRVDKGVQFLRTYLTKPENLIVSALTTELGMLLIHVNQFYKHTIFFPPAGGQSGSFASLMHSLFFWIPNFQVNVNLPEIYAFRYRTDSWGAMTWWFTTTVLPALAASTILNYVQTGRTTHRTGHNTRQASKVAGFAFDPLTFALVRFALLLYPLTTAAPSAMVDSLEMSGNPQGRALGAGLLAALMLAERLQHL